MTRLTTKKKWVIGSSAGIVLLAGGIYVVGYLASGDRVPNDATVAGVPIGGLTERQAVAKLQRELGSRLGGAVTIRNGETSVRLDPAESGLRIDFRASVTQSGVGRSWSPRHVVQVLRGGTDQQPVARIDTATLHRSVQAAAPRFALEPKNASVSLKGTEINRAEAANGRALHIAKTVKVIEEGWPARRTINAAVTTNQPDVTTAEADKLVRDTLRPALSSQVKLTGEGGVGTLTVTRAMIAQAMTISSNGSSMTATVDEGKLWTAVQPAIKSLKLTGPRDARFILWQGKPRIVPSQVGRTVDRAELPKRITPLLTRSVPRTATLPIVTEQPKFTTSQANKMGVKEITGEFSTRFPYSRYRNVNLTRAAEQISGTYIAPGATFSFNDTLGKRTRDNGYIDGYVINGGRLVKETGGGVSQMATTTFNAAFFAGLTDVEHHPHTLYFPRYPKGREATVYFGRLDLRFKNSTPYGVLLQAHVKKASSGRRGTVTVKAWSTRMYEVRSSDPVTYGYHSGTKRYSDAPRCEYQAPVQGFTVTYKRLFYRSGKLVRSEPFKWSYDAGDEIVCGGRPDDE